MTEAVALTARAAASRLEPQLGDGIAPAVEAALAQPDARVESYADPSVLIALGGLIVAAAGLAWQIYRDLKSDMAKHGQAAAPSAEAIERTLRIRIETPKNVEAVQVEVIVKTVATLVVQQSESAP